MAYRGKAKHRRYESYSSAISIFSYGPESESSESEDSGLEMLVKEIQTSETIEARPSLESINIYSNTSFARANSRRPTKSKIDPLSKNKCGIFRNPCMATVCKCLIS